MILLSSIQHPESSKAGGDPEEIINGEELPRGERPYLVELRWKLPTGEFPDGRTYQHLCGGTLIGPRTVLTAARKLVLNVVFCFSSIFNS